MKTFSVAAALAACLASTSSATATTASENLSPRQASSGSLPVITQKGNAFFNGNDRFYIRGVAYQPGGSSNVADPLLDTTTLATDITNFKTLGINTIRVYTVDNSKSHDEAMSMLSAAGIYLALDVNTPTYSLNNADAYNLHLSYNDKYLQSVFATVDMFSSYTNTLLFLAGNEVINAVNNTEAAPYVKAVVRDMKTYLGNRKYRAIPVGYAAADVSTNIDNQLTYMDCGADISRVDFFGMNDYSWCDPSSFVQSGWAAKVQQYSSYGSPIFMAEYGCITNERTWQEVKSLYSTQMSPVYSGGIAYEYSTEANGYGLVDTNDQPNGDFMRLEAMLKSTPDPTGLAGARTGAPASACPAYSSSWNVKNLTLPAPPLAIKKYETSGAGTGPGITKQDDSSQYGGSSSALSSYSQSWIAMDQTIGTSTGSSSSSESSSSSGSSSSGSSSSGSGGSSGASAIQLGITAFMIITGSMMGALLL